MALLCLYRCGLLEVNCLEKKQVDSGCCCSVLQCVAVCCIVLQRVVAYGPTLSILPRAVGSRLPRKEASGLMWLLRCVAICCSVLRCAAVCSSVL